jgi:hypothetical protein
MVAPFHVSGKALLKVFQIWEQLQRLCDTLLATAVHTVGAFANFS